MKEVNLVILWGKNIPCRGKGNCKGLELGVCLTDLRKSKGARMARTM